MTTDNKTLADVQPGGRVRLGNGDEKPPQELPKLVVTRGDGIPLPDQAAGIEEFKRQCLRRIGAEYPHLSAQPSPGGQGDALPPLPAMGYEVRGTGMGPHDVYYTPAAYTAEQMQDYARAALAARQPVGEPVAYLNGDEFVCATEYATMRSLGHDGNGWRPLYAAPPAQAVDLGQFRDVVADWRDRCCRAADKNTIVNMAKADRLLALIDKAVGNG